MKIFSFPFLVLVAAGLFFPDAEASELQFPLKVKTRLTGSFAENRGLHFHAGVDLSTGGREGLAVFAAADGWIYRLRLSPYGYGKAVYLKLADGRFAVYAHLSDFAPFLKKIVRRRQEEKENFRIDYYPPPGKIPVKRGQLIAYSGSSGAAAPHLHFELRDEKERPLNPLTHGMTVEDSSPPLIEGVAVRPLNGFSSADRRRAYLLLSAKQAREADPIPVWGRFGLEVSAYDPSGGNRLGIWRAELRLDDRLLFVNQYEEFSYRQYHQAPLIYDRELALAGAGDYQRLYRSRGDVLPFHPSPPNGSGILQTTEPDREGYLAPGVHRLQIAVYDAAGGSGLIEFKLKAEKPSREKIPRGIEDEIGGKRGADFRLEFHRDYLIVYVRAPDIPPDRIKLSFQAAGFRTDITVAPAENGYYLGALDLPEKLRGKATVTLELTSAEGEKSLREEKIFLQPVTPRGGGTVLSADGWARAEFKGGEVHSPVFMRVSADAPPRKGEECAGPVYAFEPSGLGLDKKARFSIRAPRGEGKNNLSRLGLYRLDGEDFVFVGNDPGSRPGWVSGFSRNPGRFALRRDSVCPEIEFLFEPEAVFPSSSPRLEARVTDAGSGISDRGLEMSLDGRKVIAEYIPFDDRLLFQPGKDLGEGKHKLSLSARDRAGNFRREERIFYIKTE